MEVVLEAVQLFGGNGYMAEYQVEQLCRDARCCRSTAARTRSRSRRSRAACSSGLSADSTYWRAVIDARAVQVEMPLHEPPTIVSDRK